MNFVTMTYARSGSSFFQRALGSHPDIGAAQEMMSGATGRGINVVKSLDRFYKVGSRLKVMGYKLMYGNITRDILDYNKKNNIKVIHLIRENLLETVLWLPWCYEGDTEGGMGPPLIVKGKIRVKIDTMVHYIKWLKNEIDKYSKYADFTITYKQMTGGDSQFFYDLEVRKKLLDFLGVKDMNLVCQLNRKNKRPRNEDVIVNWDRVLETIKQKGLVTKYVKL